ncbi:unnamed protein product [Peronospora effusa]|uniref:Uncharacterized protein n=1 Tax=Peronospora effusa TaxID=542832 RepID=A0A425CH50_9STRA|nr:hypothetical protein DD237_003897 [Peronospora effusa]CAI5705752.1 unnamed protein product [Peronospora effusa]
MTISRGVYNQLFEQAPDATDGSKEKVIRLRPTEAKAGAVVMSAKNKIQMWTKEEHDRFLAALEKFPAGPWKKVADFIGTKTPRQTMTHAQKYRQKIHRRQRGLRNQKKSDQKDSTNVNTSNMENPAPVDTKKDVKVELNALVSPFGVADLQLQPGSNAAMAVVTGATNDQLLNILAQQATTIHDKPGPMEVDEVDQGTAEMDVSVSLEATAGEDTDGSFNNNLPSLAEILHLGGAEGQTAVETEETQLSSKDDDELTTEVKTETETKAEEEGEVQTASEDCKCKCTCSAHGGKKAVVGASMTQSRPEES